MILTGLPQIQALSVREKLELVDEIWKSVGPELEAMEVSAEEKELLDQRWADFIGDPASALTPQQFKDKLAAIRA
ncbi:MAG: addiction module protein [Luteolibacter sp.]